MKLIVRDYLKSLKEDGELDRLLVDLLSQMGLEIQGSPKKGVAQSGVDLWAVGKMPRDNELTDEAVYLVSVKCGNLTRDNWTTSGKQSLLSSLEEIFYDFIPNHIPEYLADKRIVVCYAIGGEVESNVQQPVKGFAKRMKKTCPDVCLEKWDGDFIAGLVCKYLLNEKLFCGEGQRLLFRSLAMVNEPEASVNSFRQFVSLLFHDANSHPQWIRTARAGILSLAILDQYCQEANNLEASFLGSDYFQLALWEHIKRAKEKNCVSEKEIGSVIASAMKVVRLCQGRYLTKLSLSSGGRYHLSLVVPGSSILNVNLRLFDALGRAASFGLTSYLLMKRLETSERNDDAFSAVQKMVDNIRRIIRGMIVNNPTLQYPVCDDFCIEVSLASQFLVLTDEVGLLYRWLACIVRNLQSSFLIGKPFMCVFKDYPRLVKFCHDPDLVKESALPSSEMIPTIAVIALSLGFSDIYRELCELVRHYLPTTDVQLWYPEKNSEQHFFSGDAMHGRQLVSLPLDDPKRFLKTVLRECEESPFNLSCDNQTPWLVFTGCRLHRIPVPIHYWYPLLKKIPIEQVSWEQFRSESNSG